MSPPLIGDDAGVDDGGRRRGRLVVAAALALLAWGALVALAVAEGRQLRAGSGSWPVLALEAAGGAVALYAAAELLLRSRRSTEPAPRALPRHRR